MKESKAPKWVRQEVLAWVSMRSGAVRLDSCTDLSMCCCPSLDALCYADDKRQTSLQVLPCILSLTRQA